MKEYLFILGREPELSVAEIEARAAEWKLEVLEIQGDVLLARTETVLPPNAINQLGGTVKLVEVIDCADRQSSSIEAIQIFMTADRLMEVFPDGRIEFGFSLYGGSNKDRVLAYKHVLRLKQELKRSGRIVRAVTSKEPQLSAVTVVRQGLLKHGKEFVLYRGQKFDVTGVTIAVQDYQAYSLRDFGRPAVDPKSGMLPPKLAQIMLNLAQVKPDDVLLDPFCGSGTVLQEAALLGIKKIHGRDSSKQAIRDSQENIRWLVKEFPSINASFDIILGEAKRTDIRPTVIVTEPYLGKPLHGNEAQRTLERQLGDLEKLYVQAFQAWADVAESGTRVVMVWPEFASQTGTLSLHIETVIEQLGFLPKRLLSPAAAEALHVLDPRVLLHAREDAKLRRQIRCWEFQKA